MSIPVTSVGDDLTQHVTCEIVTDKTFGVDFWTAFRVPTELFEPANVVKALGTFPLPPKQLSLIENGDDDDEEEDEDFDEDEIEEDEDLEDEV